MLYDDLSHVSLNELMAAQNWQAKYRLITDWGKLITHKAELRNSEYLVRGCETLVWLGHSIVDDKHRFAFDSDSRVMNGLAALLLSLIDNKISEELVNIQVNDVLQQSGLEKHITPSRNNGFKTIVEQAYKLSAI